MTTTQQRWYNLIATSVKECDDPNKYDESQLVGVIGLSDHPSRRVRELGAVELYANDMCEVWVKKSEDKEAVNHKWILAEDDESKKYIVTLSKGDKRGLDKYRHDDEDFNYNNLYTSHKIGGYPYWNQGDNGFEPSDRNVVMLNDDIASKFNLSVIWEGDCSVINVILSKEGKLYCGLDMC